uniref:Uncharacterized protein n=1 Tax=Rhodococcus sp. Mel TaxID=1093626 RepID=H8ZKU3_9NOCA|nr:hypothetical protein [Rhodococcus sp. Mel]
MSAWTSPHRRTACGTNRERTGPSAKDEGLNYANLATVIGRYRAPSVCGMTGMRYASAH